MAVLVKKITYKGWRNCVQISNSQADLIVTADVGPRVIRFGFKGGVNEFKEYEQMVGKKGGKKWLIYGGHRLWHAPEQMPRTYFPDNQPVKVEKHKGFVRFIQPVETTTGIQKEIDITLAPSQAKVKVLHRLRNLGPWAVELAPWALTVMAHGGRIIIPLPPRGPHTDPRNLLPCNIISMWSYTDMQDPRWTWGSRYLMLRQDPGRHEPQKIGVLVRDGWTAYANHGNLFVKKFTYRPGASYPDYGCSVETFTNDEMLEVETCAPYVKLEPGAAVEHTEHWSLFKNVPMPRNDADVDRDVLPVIKKERAVASSKE